MVVTPDVLLKMVEALEGILTSVAPAVSALVALTVGGERLQMPVQYIES